MVVQKPLSSRPPGHAPTSCPVQVAFPCGGEIALEYLPIMQRILSLAVVATQLRTSAKALGHDR
jgi:hypothetical protein